MTYPAGTIVNDKYQIIRCLGVGGMGAVYHARDVGHENFEVALKILFPGRIKGVEMRERFRQELQVAYRVHHENVVRAYDFFEFDGTSGYALEYVDGRDLFSLIESNSLTPFRIAEIFRQICCGLEAIHEQGIVHRDMKLENILISSEGTVKIADFGVAHLSDSIAMTEGGIMVGTPKYVAPEYVSEGKADSRADIYALGVMAFETIARDTPFKSKTKQSLLKERFHVRGRSLASKVRNCPHDFVEIVDKAMAIDVKDRYQSAAEMRTDLEAFLVGQSLPHHRRKHRFKTGHITGFLKRSSYILHDELSHASLVNWRAVNWLAFGLVIFLGGSMAAVMPWQMLYRNDDIQVHADNAQVISSLDSGDSKGNKSSTNIDEGSKVVEEEEALREFFKSQRVQVDASGKGR